jgi:hypothetical protein
MHLLPLLRSYAPIPVQAPPLLDEADAAPDALRAVLDLLIRLAQDRGSPSPTLGLLAANITVPPPQDEDPPLVASGNYVSVTLQGAGNWSPDWRWRPGDPTSDLGSGTSLLTPAGVRLAYGRALGGSSAVTIFLPLVQPAIGDIPAIDSRSPRS